MRNTTDATRMTPQKIRARKGGAPLVCLTAYTTPMAQRLDAAVDLMLVGDSLAMVIYGLPTTVGITLETMIAHGRAVVRGGKQACVIIDMPAGTYESGPNQALANARRTIDETGAHGVKLEGGVAIAEAIRCLVDNEIPVLGHVGLLPQQVTKATGFQIQGQDQHSWEKILADARAVEAAGAFALVIEGTVEPLALQITKKVGIPTIGIGASVGCDGQILVTEDMLGLFNDFTPKFVKRFGTLGTDVDTAVTAYVDEVRARRFPGPEHVYAASKKNV